MRPGNRCRIASVIRRRMRAALLSLAVLAAAGVLHFVWGRYCNYRATKAMGLEVPPSRHGIKVSPINRRRWQNFKANRRGYVAFWIFLVLFFGFGTLDVDLDQVAGVQGQVVDGRHPHGDSALYETLVRMAGRSGHPFQISAIQVLDRGRHRRGEGRQALPLGQADSRRDRPESSPPRGCSSA